MLTPAAFGATASGPTLTRVALASQTTSRLAAASPSTGAVPTSLTTGTGAGGSFLDRIPTWGKVVGVGALALGAAYVVYRVVKK